MPNQKMEWTTAWAKVFDILAPRRTPVQIATWLNRRQSLTGDILLFEAQLQL